MRVARTWWPIVAFAVCFVFAAVFVVKYGYAAHDLQPDEFDTVGGGRKVVDAFFQTTFAISPLGRGPERLAALVFALPTWLFSSTATVFRAAHVLLGLLYLSASVPVFALARGLGLERWQAVLPAAASILTPWMLYGGTLLNTTLAYPTAMALAWATWRAAVRPGWRGDGLVLLFGVLGAMAREGHAAFLGAAALALIVALWRERPAGESVAHGLRAYPRRLLRAHPLLCAAAGALLLLVVVLGKNRLLGSAYQPTSSQQPVTLSGTLSATWRAAAELTMGTGYVPMIIALPWLARELVRPRSPQTGAFALTVVAMFLAFIGMIVYFAATTSGLSDNERYLAVLAGLPPLAAALAIFRREVSPVGVAIGGMLLARAIVTQGIYPTTGAYDYFLAPARLFFTVVMQGQVSSHLPFNDNHVATTLLLAIVLATVVVAFLCARPGRLGPTGLAACAVLALGAPVALGAASGIYVGDKFETLGTLPALSFEQQTFIDAADDQRPAAFWDYAPGADPRVPYESNQAAFFNRSVRATLLLSGMAATSAIGRRVVATVDADTGVLHTTSPLPSYLLVPESFTRVGFAGQVVAGPTGVLGPLPFALLRIGDQPRIAWVVSGTDDAGWIIPPAHDATIRLFPSPQPSCWQTAVIVPPVLAKPLSYLVNGPGLKQHGALGPAGAAPIRIRNVPGGPVDVRISVAGAGALASGERVAAHVDAFTPVRCS